MKRPEGVHPIRVFVARNLMEAELAVDFLEDRGIPSRVENPLTHGTLSVIEPLIDGIEGVAVVVSSDRAAAAEAAIAEFKANPPLDEDSPLPEGGEE